MTEEKKIFLSNPEEIHGPGDAEQSSPLLNSSDPRVHDTNQSLWVSSVGDICAKDYPKPEPLVDGLLHTGEQMLIYGRPGVGKSYIVQKLATHLSMGQDFSFYRIRKPKKVLIVDGEMPPENIKSRFMQMYKPLENLKEFETAKKNLFYISRFILPQHREINIKTGQYEDKSLEAISLRTLEEKKNTQQLMNTIRIMDPDLVVLDNIFCLYSFQDYSSPTEWIESVNPLLNFLRSKNTACIIVDHANKNNGLFGTMAKTITLDTLIRIDGERTDIDIHDDSDTTADWKFKFVFEKARRLTSIEQDDVEFEIKDGDVFAKQNSDREQISLIRKYYEEGYSMRDIVTIMLDKHDYNISQMKPSRLGKKFGWVKPPKEQSKTLEKDD